MSADKDLLSVQQARDLVEAAHRAQQEVAGFDQAKIDRICDVMAKAALRESPRVAALAVEETGYGVIEDKVQKNLFASWLAPVLDALQLGQRDVVPVRRPGRW